MRLTTCWLLITFIMLSMMLSGCSLGGNSGDNSNPVPSSNEVTVQAMPPWVNAPLADSHPPPTIGITWTSPLGSEVISDNIGTEGVHAGHKFVTVPVRASDGRTEYIFYLTVEEPGGRRVTATATVYIYR
jgi:hypothetical protein